MNRAGHRSPTIGRLAAWPSLGLALAAPGRSARSRRPGPPTAAPGTRRALIVCGLPGDDEHRALYAGAVEKIAKALVDRCGFAAADVWVRFGVEPKDGDGPALKGSRGLSTREGIAADAEALRKASTPEDALWVIVLGHGHFDGRRSHLNLPGPDLSDAAFGRLFEGIKAKEQVFFVTTSASGFFLRPLASPGRVAISATEADQEVNETLFPLALADMLAAPPPEADRDKDGALSRLRALPGRRRRRDPPLRRGRADPDRARPARRQRRRPGHRGPDDLPPPRVRRRGRRREGRRTRTRTRPKDEAEKAEPKLGPKDDGFLASKVRVDRPGREGPPMERSPDGMPSTRSGPWPLLGQALDRPDPGRPTAGTTAADERLESMKAAMKSYDLTPARTPPAPI